MSIVCCFVSFIGKHLCSPKVLAAIVGELRSAMRRKRNSAKRSIKEETISAPAPPLVAEEDVPHSQPKKQTKKRARTPASRETPITFGLTNQKEINGLFESTKSASEKRKKKRTVDK